jgi:DMSO/TMAO reductase YedYZ heme-binding membrane subunit
MVALVLLTGVLMLGVLGPLRVASGRWPRFAIGTLHRDLSLLAILVIAIHVLVAVLDGFVKLSLIDAVIPFAAGYRPFWVGLGALAFDLMLALVITSLLRRRLGYSTWRFVHWLAYASWPLAVAHGLGTGYDSGQAWALLLTLACIAAVGIAVLARLNQAVGASERVAAARPHPDPAGHLYPDRAVRRREAERGGRGRATTTRRRPRVEP